MPLIPMPIVGIFIVLPLVAFWAWMFRAMITNDTLPESAKNTWTFVFILFNVFGAVIYYATEYRNGR